MTETTATLEQPTAGEQLVVDEPGVYDDIPELIYHADPVPEGSLSVSGAKKLLPPSCPAIYKWELDNGQPPKRQFDIGHAAHAFVLGVGLDLEVIPGERWDTKAAKDAVAEVRARGAVPLKESEMAAAAGMAEALRAHPVAGALLTPGTGRAEVSIFWRDPATGVMRRGRIDWLRHPHNDRVIITDYKTAVSASPQKFRNAAGDYGYHMQAAWYVDGALALELAEDVAFVFVVQEKTPPYLVSVVELDSLAMRIGRHDNRKALDIYVECRTADRWPPYSEDVELISLPGWMEHRYAEESA